MTWINSLKRAAGLLVCAVVVAAPCACIVSDQDLPCRRDCECPSGQVCSTKGVCGGGSAKPQGDTDGPCAAGDTCTGTLVCLKDDVCGDMVCRQRCTVGQTSTTSCPTSHVCQDVRTGDETPPPGAAEGACVP